LDEMQIDDMKIQSSNYPHFSDNDVSNISIDDGRTKIDPVDGNDNGDEIMEDDEEKVLPDGEIINDLVYTVLLNKGKTSFDINIGT
jgi:hypothetical protein